VTTGVILVLLALLVFWSVRLLLLAREVGDYRRYWSTSRGTVGGLRYVAMGDSLAQGIGASSPTKGYVALLAAQISRATGRPVEIVNISRSGARIADVLRGQLPRLPGLHADFVTVDVGGNDVRHFHRASWAADAAQLCSALPSGRTVVADVPWFMHGNWEREARDARGILRSDCEPRGIAFAPLMEAFARHGWAGMFTLYAADWFHPNNHGYRIWAGSFFRAVEGDATLRLTLGLVPRTT
jgi:lysophospholipase L1-like esterase